MHLGHRHQKCFNLFYFLPLAHCRFFGAYIFVPIVLSFLKELTQHDSTYNTVFAPAGPRDILLLWKASLLDDFKRSTVSLQLIHCSSENTLKSTKRKISFWMPCKQQPSLLSQIDSSMIANKEQVFANSYHTEVSEILYCSFSFSWSGKL